MSQASRADRRTNTRWQLRSRVRRRRSVCVPDSQVADSMKRQVTVTSGQARATGSPSCSFASPRFAPTIQEGNTPVNQMSCLAVTMVFCGALGACTTTPEAETASVSEGALTSDSTSKAQESGGSGRQISLSDMERANLNPDDGQSQVAADCVFVEWCNRPANISPDIGTVCRVRPGCALDQAAIDECVRDTNAVCGTPVQPWWICPQGVSCP